MHIGYFQFQIIDDLGIKTFVYQPFSYFELFLKNSGCDIAELSTMKILKALAGWNSR